MLGAIAGDIIGSVREVFPIKTKSFDLFPAESRFTDDSVTTLAVARAILNAVSLGGDSDTLACITGSIAEAYYEYGEGRGGGRGISQAIRDEVARRLTPDLAAIVQTSYKRFG